MELGSIKSKVLKISEPLWWGVRGGWVCNLLLLKNSTTAPRGRSKKSLEIGFLWSCLCPPRSTLFDWLENPTLLLVLVSLPGPSQLQALSPIWGNSVPLKLLSTSSSSVQSESCPHQRVGSGMDLAALSCSQMGAENRRLPHDAFSNSTSGLLFWFLDCSPGQHPEESPESQPPTLRCGPYPWSSSNHTGSGSLDTDHLGPHCPLVDTVLQPGDPCTEHALQSTRGTQIAL